MEAEVWYVVADGTVDTDFYRGGHVTVQMWSDGRGRVAGRDVSDSKGRVRDVLYSTAVKMIRRPVDDDAGQA